MFSLNKNYPENLKLRQIVTDLIFWHKDIDKDEGIEELIKHHYEILRNSVAHNVAHGSFVVNYQFENFSGQDLEDLDWLVGFGLIECKLSCHRKPEKLGIESNTWSDDILKIKIEPVDELIQYLNNFSMETRLRIASKISQSVQKLNAYGNRGTDSGFNNICVQDETADAI